MRQVSLRDANQNFAKLIAEVEAGEQVVLTRRGRPVARIVPETPRKRMLTAEQQAAYERMVERLRRGYDLGGLKVNRDEIYDRKIML
jgi:prevent-host-death family protein